MTALHAFARMDASASQVEHLSPARLLAFGAFQLRLPDRILTKGETRVRIGSRAMEILVVLLEAPGELVLKRRLMRSVWSDVAVEEGTLRVHISSLRKALADERLDCRYIDSVTGLGYRFVAPVSLLPREAGGRR